MYWQSERNIGISEKPPHEVFQLNIAGKLVVLSESKKFAGQCLAGGLSGHPSRRQLDYYDRPHRSGPSDADERRAAYFRVLIENRFASHREKRALFRHNPVSLADGPNATGGGQRTNQTTFQVNGTVWDWDPQLNHMTGTLTSFDMVGGNQGTFTYFGTDGRNAAGTTGTIQMIAPSLAYSYFLGGSAWDGSGNNPVSSLTTESDNSQITTLTFLPEPAGFLMLGAGVLGLLGLNLLHRRRH